MSSMLVPPAPAPAPQAKTSATTSKDPAAGDLFAQLLDNEFDQRQSESKPAAEHVQHGSKKTASATAPAAETTPKAKAAAAVEEAIADGTLAGSGIDLDALLALLTSPVPPTAEQLQPFVDALAAQGSDVALTLAQQLSKLTPAAPVVAALPVDAAPAVESAATVEAVTPVAPASGAAQTATDSGADGDAATDADDVLDGIAQLAVVDAQDTITTRDVQPPTLARFLAKGEAPAQPAVAAPEAPATEPVRGLETAAEATSSTTDVPAVLPVVEERSAGTRPETAPLASPSAAPAVVTAPATTASATATAGQPQATTSTVVQQVFPEVTRVAGTPGTHRISITLNPAELGEVRVTVVVRGDQVRVDFHSDQARQALTDGSSELHKLLAGLGRSDVQVTVRDSQGQQFFQEGRQHAAPQRDADAESQREDAADQLWQDIADETLVDELV